MRPNPWKFHHGHNVLNVQVVLIHNVNGHTLLDVIIDDDFGSSWIPTASFTYKKNN